MGCYGIGPSRLMGTIVEARNDNRGIIWPEEVAPFMAHLIELKAPTSAGKQNSKLKADEIYNKLREAGIEALYDDRAVGAGEKFADADLIGCPIRIVVSEKTLKKDSVEVKRRDSDEAELVGVSEIVKWLNG